MTPSSNQSEIVLDTTPEGTVEIDIIFQNETIMITRKKTAELFDVNVPVISKHLSNIFEAGELQKETTISKMETVQLSKEVEVPFCINYSLIRANCPQVKMEIL